VHPVAFVEDHVTVTDWPAVTVVGLAEIVTVGTGGFVTVKFADVGAVAPFGPSQVMVYVYVPTPVGVTN
jgi:hypothetical protein